MPYDIFISYSRNDNKFNRITELKEKIETDYRDFTGEDLHCFFDIDEIHGMDDWRHNILTSLRESNLLLLVLSPSYIKSDYCKWEIIEYLKYEYSRATGGQGIAPIYFVEVPDIDTTIYDQKTEGWITQVRRRNHFDLRPWYDEGALALKRLDVRTRLNDLERTLQNRISKLRRISASPGNLPAHNPYFVGRENEIQQLHESAGLGCFGVITVMHGIGGLGKTALSIQYAYAYVDFYPGGHWLIRCTGEKNLASIIRRLDVDLGITVTEEEKNDDDRIARRILVALEKLALKGAEARAGENNPPAPRALLILDNVDFPELVQPPQSDLISGKQWLHVIATTRISGDDFGKNHNRLKLLPIDELPREDAVRLLENHQPQSCFSSKVERNAAEDIVKILGGFTLAVEVAAIYLGEQYGQISCKAFLDKLRREGLTGVEDIGKTTRSGLQYNQKLVSATLASTLDLLQEEELFILLCASHLPPDMIPVPWLRTLAIGLYQHLDQKALGGCVDPWISLINHLLGTRLIQVVEIDPDRKEVRLVRMHRLVQYAIRTKQHTDDSFIISYVRQRSTLLSFPGSWGRKHIQWEVIAISATARFWLNRSDGAGVEIGASISRALLGLQCTQEAVQLLETVTEQSRRIFGPDHSVTATCLNSYSDMLREMNRFDEAESAIADAIALDSNPIAFIPWHLARDYDNLGKLLHAKGSKAEAERIYLDGLRILTGTEQFSPEVILQTAILKHNLADLWRDQGKLNQAIEGFLASLPLFQNALGSQHPYIATIYNNLAVAYHQSKRFNDAEKAYNQSLHLFEESLGNNHLRVANSLHHLSILYCDSRRSQNAIPLLRRAIGIMRNVYLLPGRDDILLVRMIGDYVSAMIYSGYTWNQILTDKALIRIDVINLSFSTFIWRAIKADQPTAVIKSLVDKIMPNHFNDRL